MASTAMGLNAMQRNVGIGIQEPQTRPHLTARLTQIRSRLMDLSNGLRLIGTQAHGPEPESAETSGKNPMPDTLDSLTQQIESLLNEAEYRAQRIATFIGQ